MPGSLEKLTESLGLTVTEVGFRIGNRKERADIAVLYRRGGQRVSGKSSRQRR